MRKILLCGCNGRMGQTVSRLASTRDDIEIYAGCDLNGNSASAYPVFRRPSEVTGKPDVVLDFSNPAALDELLVYSFKHTVPLALCATGYDAAQLAQIERAAEQVPIFRSGNMSLGVHLMMELARNAAAVLGADFDVEIVERHHRNKVDAPSGTALMLYDAISSALPYPPEAVYDRHPERKPRGNHEIGMHAVRGGTIVGEHEVIFAGHDEIITITHSARSREVFAAGAIRASLFMADVAKPGLYDMRNLV